ncbi:Retrovirus-related Pol polyprotein from transposon RE1, partial [Linum perenne]
VTPARTVKKEGTEVANPDFVRWFRQDKLILHAIRCSVSENIFPYVTAAQSTHEAWLILEKLYASRSRSRVLNLKDRLAREKQGDRDVATYIHAMKNLAAELSLVQTPVDDDDLVVHCLRGLRTEYHHFAASIRAHGTTTTVEDLLDILVDYEADLKAQQPEESAVPTVYYTHQRGRSFDRGRNFGQGRRNHRGGGGGFSSPGNYGTERGRGKGYDNPSFFSRSQQAPYSSSLSGPPSNWQQARPAILCQFCNKPGHSA